MNEFIRVQEDLPPEGELVLVWFGEFYGFGLRMLVNDAWYDEHEDLDDSEIPVLQWAYLQAPVESFFDEDEPDLGEG